MISLGPARSCTCVYNDGQCSALLVLSISGGYAGLPVPHSNISIRPATSRMISIMPCTDTSPAPDPTAMMGREGHSCTRYGSPGSDPRVGEASFVMEMRSVRGTGVDTGMGM